MLKRVILLSVLLLSIGLRFPVTNAQDDAEGMCQGIALVEGWVRPTVSSTTAIYGKFINLGAEDDMLIGISSDIAPTIEIHESSMTEGMMEMRPMEGGIHLPAQGVVSLEAGGLHGMVIGLEDFVEVGQTVAVTFEFMNAGSFEVELVAGDPAEFDNEAPPQALVLNGEHCTDTIGFYGVWSRPGIAGGSSAIYGILLNLSETDDILFEVSSDIAEAVELHESSKMDDGTMMMHPVDNGIAVSAGSYTILQPGGVHIMLINLINPLNEEMTFDANLVFASDYEINLLVPVLPLAQKNSMEHTE